MRTIGALMIVVPFVVVFVMASRQVGVTTTSAIFLRCFTNDRRHMKPEFIALIGDKRIPTTAKVIAAYIRTQGRCPFEFVPAPDQDVEKDEPTGADWNQK